MNTVENTCGYHPELIMNTKELCKPKNGVMPHSAFIGHRAHDFVEGTASADELWLITRRGVSRVDRPEVVYREEYGQSFCIRSFVDVSIRVVGPETQPTHAKED